MPAGIFSNCVFFLLFFTLPQFIPAVISLVALLVLRLVISEMPFIQVGIYCILYPILNSFNTITLVMVVFIPGMSYDLMIRQ